MAIDGKTRWRSHDQTIGQDAIHIVSAWASQNGIALSQRKVDGKSIAGHVIPAMDDGQTHSVEVILG